MEKTLQRTLQQNRALYKYFELVAEALNNAGLTVQKILPRFKIELEWTPEMIKEVIWKTPQRTMLKKESTAELSIRDIDTIHEVINRFLGTLGVDYIPFPFECKSCGGLSQHSKNCSEK